jgi:hypothetical protein
MAVSVVAWAESGSQSFSISCATAEDVLKTIKDEKVQMVELLHDRSQARKSHRRNAPMTMELKAHL